MPQYKGTVDPMSTHPPKFFFSKKYPPFKITTRSDPKEHPDSKEITLSQMFTALRELFLDCQ